VGDTVTVLVPAPVDVVVTGIATFAGGQDGVGGVTNVFFPIAVAQQLLLGSTDVVSDVVLVARDGISEADLVGRVRPRLPAGVEAVTGDELTREQQQEIEDDFLGFFTAALLVFAAIALLVAAFSIFNTFSILVAQRTRETALVRALGASRRQVLGSALVESVVVGLAGSVVGVVVGLGVAAGLLALMDAAGFGLPTDGLEVSARTVLAAVGVGLVVTVVGGIGPAWRASRVAPLAALREAAIDGSGSSRWRAGVGALCAAGGGALMLVASGRGELGPAGLGAVLLVGGVILLGPFLARPVGSVLGAPLALRGTSGQLARRNAVRNPRRTAATSTALLLGVGVVTLFTVFGASVSRSFERTVERSFGGDLVLSAPGAFSGAGLDPAVVARVADLPEVSGGAGLGNGAATVDGRDTSVGFADPAALASVLDLDVGTGDLAALGDDRIAVSQDEADERGWSIGSPVEIGFVDGSTRTMTVGATYDDDTLAGTVLVPEAEWLRHDPQASLFLVVVELSDGTSLAQGRAAVEAATTGAGAVEVMDRDEFVDAQLGRIDVLLTVIYGLLAVAILIALMGIANTLSLSVHERTRELGLLRAVGQSRAGLRAMVRWESVIVTTFGSLAGLGLGLFLGWQLVRVLASSDPFVELAVPFRSLAVVLVVGALVGVVAGVRPAWRASRLDVLEALASP
jgi:putative ABC transport system permease protein